MNQTAPVGFHKFRPRGACSQVFRERAGEVLVSGPAGTGKSRACLEKLMAMCLANPGMRGLIVRKTQKSLSASALNTWRRDVAKEALAIGAVSYYGGSAVEPAQYRYSNGSVVLVAGMDQASKVMSTEFDVIYVQEATELTEDDWEALTTRLRNGKVSFQQLIADCNPGPKTHWLKVRCDQGRTLKLESRHEDNPMLYTADGELTEFGASYMAKLDNLTGVRHARLRLGQWVSTKGMIYEAEWNESKHLVDRFDIPDSWNRYWAVDFGYTHPFVLQCWAEDPDGRLFMYREIYHTKRTVDQHAKFILAEVTENGKWTEPKPRAIVADSADAEGRAVLRRELGMGVTEAKKDVLQGIQAVQKRLREDRLFILRDSLLRRDNELADAKKPTCTQEEFPGYVWDDKKSEKGEDRPVKEDDDGMDTLRYMVAHRDLQPRTGFRWAGV